MVTGRVDSRGIAPVEGKIAPRACRDGRRQAVDRLARGLVGEHGAAPSLLGHTAKRRCRLRSSRTGADNSAAERTVSLRAPAADSINARRGSRAVGERQKMEGVHESVIH